jgi:hypothetical protein
MARYGLGQSLRLADDRGGGDPDDEEPNRKEWGIMQTTATTVSLDQRLGKRARAQLVMLIAQFLLGMGVNLVGQPSETTGAAKVVSQTALTGHLAVAVGLIVGAILTVRRAAAVGPELRTQSWIGVALVAITIAAGVLTLTLASNWWSYLMAVGFIALLVLYGNIYVRTRSR